MTTIFSGYDYWKIYSSNFTWKGNRSLHLELIQVHINNKCHNLELERQSLPFYRAYRCTPQEKLCLNANKCIQCKVCKYTKSTVGILIHELFQMIENECCQQYQYTRNDILKKYRNNEYYFDRPGFQSHQGCTHSTYIAIQRRL